jgi:hypothetical protein
MQTAVDAELAPKRDRIEASRGARVKVLGTSSINGAHQAVSLTRHAPQHQDGFE